MNSGRDRHRNTTFGKQQHPLSTSTANGSRTTIEGRIHTERAHVSPSISLRTRGRQARDHNFMAQLAGGDEGALEALMHLYARWLLIRLDRIVHNPTDAAELVQETFIRVFQHRNQFNFRSRFSSWLYTIGLNLARNLLRRRKRQPELLPLREDGELTDREIEEALIHFPPTPARQAETNEWVDALETALHRMPKSLSDPLELVALDGCSQAQAAEKLGCTIKAVETRLHHVRMRLRTEFESIYDPWKIRVNARIRLRNPG